MLRALRRDAPGVLVSVAVAAAAMALQRAEVALAGRALLEALVLAATAPVSSLSAQGGRLVKLVRVPMLGRW